MTPQARVNSRMDGSKLFQFPVGLGEPVPVDQSLYVGSYSRDRQRIEPQRRLPHRKGLGIASEVAEKEDSHPEIDDGVVGVQLDGLLEVCQGFIQIPLEQQEITSGRVRFGERRIKGHRLVDMRCCSGNKSGDWQVRIRIQQERGQG